MTSSVAETDTCTKSPHFGIYEEDKVRKHMQEQECNLPVPNAKGDPFASIQQVSEKPAFLSCLEKVLCYECFSHYNTGMKF